MVLWRGDHDNVSMHTEIEWLKPSDRPILRFYERVEGLWIKPASAAHNVSRTRYTIANRTRVLAEAGLLERLDEESPAYRITDLGKEFLRDELTIKEVRGLLTETPEEKESDGSATSA